MPEYNALRVDTRGTGIQPVLKVTSCKRAPKDWWIFGDASLTSGTFAVPATTVAMARGNPYELGGQITQPDLLRGDAPVFLVNQILEAQRRNGEWEFLTQWAGYDTLTVQPESYESDFEGCDSVVRGMLDMAKARYLGAVEEAAKRSGAKRSR
eukprot:4254735-Pleurochrysis_carterae.AAC.1